MADTTKTLPQPTWPAGFKGQIGADAYTADQMRAYAAEVLAAKAHPKPKPYAWAVTGLSRPFFGEFAEDDARAEARRCGGTSTAFALIRMDVPQRAPTDAEPAQAERQPLPRGYLLHWPLPGGDRKPMWVESRIAGDAIGCPVEPIFSFGIGAEGAAPQPAQAERQPLTREKREAVFKAAEAAMAADPNLSWRDAIVNEVERAHGIDAKAAGQEGGAP